MQKSIVIKKWQLFCQIMENAILVLRIYMINNEATKLYEIFKDEKVETLVNIDRSKVIDFYKDLRMALFLNYYFEKPTIDHINRLLTNSRLDLQEALQHLNIDIEPIINELYTHI